METEILMSRSRWSSFDLCNPKKSRKSSMIPVNPIQVRLSQHLTMGNLENGESSANPLKSHLQDRPRLSTL